MCNIKAKGRLRMEPERVFDILVAPDNYKYFSGIKVSRHNAFLEQNVPQSQCVRLSLESHVQC